VKLEKLKRHIPLRLIVLDKAAQPRTAIDQSVVEEYTERMAVDLGATWPPVILFHDPTQKEEVYYCADGFHRVLAARQIENMPVIGSRVYEGTLRDAIFYSVGVNAKHGVQRSNKDKRKAVETLLTDEEWSTWSDSSLAEQAKVSQTLVSKIRRELEAKTGRTVQRRRMVTKDGHERTIDTSRIGKKAKPSSKPKEKVEKPWKDNPWPKRFDRIMGPERQGFKQIEASVQEAWKAAQTAITEAQDNPRMRFAKRVRQKLDVHFSNLLADIRKELLPAGPCTACKGEGDGCPVCDGGGWLPAGRLRPEDERWDE
jgi:hypothetical protein